MLEISRRRSPFVQVRQRRRAGLVAFVLCLFMAGLAFAEPPQTSTPESVPVTRDDMKRVLDASKGATPRLPLPPVTEAETRFIEEQKAEAARTGESPRRFGLANNGRMRAFYLSEYGFDLSEDLDRARTGASRSSSPGLDPNLRTAIFWIVSRGNNCTYCLGHQESSLASRGMSDDELAALDFDWSVFDEARQAAFTFARKASFEPYALTDADIEALRKHYDEKQVADLIVAVAGFNATNRWTGPLRIKQDVLFPFVRETSAEYASRQSPIAPANVSAAENGLAPPQPRTRPALEPWTDVELKLAAARERSPRVKLVESKPGDENAPQWVRFLKTLDESGNQRIESYRAVLDKGTLDPRTKAIIAYVGARHDRAWYALGHAIARLKEFGFSDSAIAALDSPDQLESPLDRDVVRFARTITIDPALVTDDDFLRLRKSFDDKTVAEIVYQITQAAFFDRLTESAGLPLEF